MDASEVLEQGYKVAGISSVREPTGHVTDVWDAVDQAWARTAQAREKRTFETGLRQEQVTAEGRGVNKEDPPPNNTPRRTPQS